MWNTLKQVRKFFLMLTKMVRTDFISSAKIVSGTWNQFLNALVCWTVLTAWVPPPNHKWRWHRLQSDVMLWEKRKKVSKSFVKPSISTFAVTVICHANKVKRKEQRCRSVTDDVGDRLDVIADEDERSSCSNTGRDHDKRNQTKQTTARSSWRRWRCWLAFAGAAWRSVFRPRCCSCCHVLCIQTQHITYVSVGLHSQHMWVIWGNRTHSPSLSLFHPSLPNNHFPAIQFWKHSSSLF